MRLEFHSLIASSRETRSSLPPKGPFEPGIKHQIQVRKSAWLDHSSKKLCRPGPAAIPCFSWTRHAVSLGHRRLFRAVSCRALWNVRSSCCSDWPSVGMI